MQIYGECIEIELGRVESDWVLVHLLGLDQVKERYVGLFVR
jgi:hypothetical protein